MILSRLTGIAALLCLLPSPAAPAGAPVPAAPVALVYSLAGEAALILPSYERRPLRLFDRLPAGAALAVGAGSRLELAFANGRRYELGERSRATLGRADLASRSGPVRPLPKVPALPRIEPIAAGEGAGPTTAVTRIRAEQITGLYPDCGAATLAGTTILRFAPVDGGGRYRIEVQDRRGNLVFATETTASVVTVPGKVLRAGRPYSWSVRTVDRASVARGQAGFVTLDSRLARGREALHRALAGDGPSWALLAEVDRSLGLLAEACDELRAAAQSAPGDPRLAARLSEVEGQLCYLQSP